MKETESVFMTEPLAPLRVIEITDMSTKQIVFGVHIHGPMDEKDAHEVSTDAVVRQYVDEFCSDCSFRTNRLANGTLSQEFQGVVCHVSEELGMLKEYTIAVRRIYSSDKKYWWWMDKLHRDGGWSEILAAYRTGVDPRPQPTPPADPFWSSFWKSFGSTLLLTTLAVILAGIVAAIAHSLSNDDR